MKLAPGEMGHHADRQAGVFAMTFFSWITAWLGPAKAKAASFGSIAEFRRRIMSMLEQRHLASNLVADAANPAKFTMTVNGDTSAVDVTNVYRYINAYPEDNATEVIDRFIRSITEDHGQPVKEDSIVALVRGREYVEGMPEEVLHEPLGADLVVLYMADLPDSMVPLTNDAVPGKDLASVRKIALDNIRKWLPKVAQDDSLRDGVLYYVEENPLLSTSLILVEDFWKSVAARFPGDVLIALPRKDQLFLFDDKSDAKSMAGIRRLIDVTIADNFNLLSPQLYARRGGKIVAVSG